MTDSFPGRIATAAVLAGALVWLSPGASDARSSASPPPLPVEVTATVDVGRHPVGVAIDGGLGLAVVASRNRSSVSLVSLSGDALGEIPVGLLPTGVAVDPETHEAIVTNAASHTVSVVDLGARIVTRTIRVGRRPVAVAVHPGQRRAIVADEGSDTVSIVDLAIGTVAATLRVGRKPAGVAVNPTAGPHGLAAVTSRIDDTLTLIDLGPAPGVRAVVALGGAGRHAGRLRPIGVAWDIARNTIVVAHSGQRAIGLLSLDGDRVTGQAVVPVGKLPWAVAVSPGSAVALVTSDKDDAFALDLATGQVIGRADVGKHPRGVALDPQACRGVVANSKDNTVSILTVPCMAALRLLALEPSSATAGARAQTLTLTGEGFAPRSVVNFGTAALTPSSVTATRIVVSVPASLLAVPGTFQVSVTAPSGETSNSLPFVVATVPLPILDALSPASTVANFQDFRLDVTGRDFLPGALIELDGQPLGTTVVDGPTQAHATVPGALVGRGRTVPVALVNPGGGVSNALSFTITNPVPALGGVTPDNAAAGSSDLDVILVGENFVLDSRVLFCSTLACTQIPSAPFLANPAVQIDATIPAALLAAPGEYRLRVVNDPPGGGVSLDQPFTVSEVTIPPGYMVTTVAVTLGHPERVTLLGPGLAVATVGGAWLQLVDVAGKRLVHTFEVPDNRHLLGDVDADQATRTAVVANANFFAPSVWVLPVDVATPAASAGTTVALPAGSVPFGVAVNPVTDQAIVSDLGDLTLKVIDLATPSLVTTIRLPKAVTTPSFTAVNAATNQAVVVDQGDFVNPGSVLVVDVARRRVLDTVTVGVGPSFVAVNPVTNVAVVANSVGNSISVIDLATRAVLREIALDEEPTGVAVDPGSNRAMVSTQRTNRIVRIDLATFAVSDVLQLGVGGAVAPSDLAWDAPQKVAVATSVTTDNLIVIDFPF